MHPPDTRQPLRGKTAVVTGGSNGIGAATVAALAAEGAQLVIGYHQGEERAEALRASLPGTHHRIARLPLDDTATHAALAKSLEQDHGQVDVLVNCAGYTTRIPHDDLERLDSGLFNEVLLANAGGTYSIMRALMPLLRRSNDATVVSVSSVAAFTGSGSNIAYCAAKAAIDTMTLSLARAFGPQVRFLCVSPASVSTGFVPGRSLDDVRKKGEATPLGRAVTPEDVALAVVGCITHLRTATGTRIVIDGGFTL
ncbi:SDR family NAD(P)-dependent oxidoreductase [Variovorax terrae]|uniref:SDR family oxidoreductase n=1 Tax=Variovorax terrae TaxID=2923278 RepID=A0A9X1W2I0_9BURK|nr:SDR family oxidoreductase [Variovorax terrae]MCJ0764888.1 SDR family oxidoreductase [Variovorax terrae]